MRYNTFAVASLLVQSYLLYHSGGEGILNKREPLLNLSVEDVRALGDGQSAQAGTQTNAHNAILDQHDVRGLFEASGGQVRLEGLSLGRVASNACSGTV